jgi:hypothetical protein
LIENKVIKKCSILWQTSLVTITIPQIFVGISAKRYSIYFVIDLHDSPQVFRIIIKNFYLQIFFLKNKS